MSNIDTPQRQVAVEPTFEELGDEWLQVRLVEIAAACVDDVVGDLKAWISDPTRRPTPVLEAGSQERLAAQPAPDVRPQRLK